MADFPAAAAAQPWRRRQAAALDADTLRKRFRKAKDRRSTWEQHWQECYDYALPLRDGILRTPVPGEKKADRLFDGTAADAVDQLAASLLAELTPPWAQWFGFVAGPDLSPEEREQVAPSLGRAAAVLQSHFDRSNFATEIHQCYLDLVTGGTASLLFEEAGPGDACAFRFTAVPLVQVVLEEGPDGRLDTTFRRNEMTVAALRQRYPLAPVAEDLLRQAEEDSELRVPVIEAVIPDGRGYVYAALLEQECEEGLLAQGRFDMAPFINFRWLKAPGEVYGRSPVMKALPDIKTANKVVELVLKNATIAVTGIWQADDDGVLNPANIKLIPGTIIPKAVGSAGLTPLNAPGRFDVSQLVLADLRNRIRHALLVDKLAQVEAPQMTATEVLERAAEMARILGATYGRLQSELLTPLVVRAVAILRRRGDIPNIVVDGRVVDLDYKSPLAQQQAKRDAQHTMSWVASVATMGPQAMGAVDVPAVARWLGRTLGVPDELIRHTEPDAPGGGPSAAAPAGAVPAGVSPAMVQAALRQLAGGQALSQSGPGAAPVAAPVAVVPPVAGEVAHG